MVTTRARGRGAPAPAPALTKAQKAEIVAMKKVENAKKKAEKAAAKAAAKAMKDKEKAAAKIKARPKAKVAVKGKSSKVGKAVKTKSSKLGKRAKASKPTYDAEDDDETESDSDSESESESDRMPTHKRRRIKNRSSSVYVAVNAKGSRTSKRRAAVDLITIDINDWDYSKELPLPKDLQTNIRGVLPRIYVGGSAPQPRWLVGQNKAMPPPFHEAGPKPRYSEGHGFTEYGKLVWYLDEGAFSLWNGLEYPQLFELAYKCFEVALKNAAVRNKIHQTLADEALPKTLTSSREWYPTLPLPPNTKYFGTPSDGPVWDVSQEQTHSGYYYMDNNRPSLAVQASGTSLHPSEHILASKLLDQITTHSDRRMDASRTKPASGGRFSRSARFKQLSVTSNLVLEQTQGPSPSNAIEAQRKSGRIVQSSSNGSVLSDDSQDDAGLEPNSAHDSRDQSPQSLFVDTDSDAEVSALSIINDAQTDDADGTSVESTHTSKSSSVTSYDGLFSASQINEYYDTKQKEFKQDHLGGKRKQAENVEDKNDEEERREKRMIDTLAAFKEVREQVVRAMAQDQAGKDKGKGRETEGDETNSEDEHDVVDLSDAYFEKARQVCKDKAARVKHFPDPIAVRRVRVWAGENLMADGPTNLNAVLPAWPDTYRPFHPWHAAFATTGSSDTASTKRAKAYTKPSEQKPLSKLELSSFSMSPKGSKP